MLTILYQDTLTVSNRTLEDYFTKKKKLEEMGGSGKQRDQNLKLVDLSPREDLLLLQPFHRYTTIPKAGGFIFISL